MVYTTPNLDYFVNSIRQWNHRENADSENDDCCHVAGIPLGIVTFILGIAFIVNRLYMLGAIVTALSVIALTIACVNSPEQGHDRHQRRFGNHFYASIRRRIARIRSAQPGTTASRENILPLRDRYHFSNQDQVETNVQEATTNERHELILSHLIHKKVLSNSRNKRKFRKKKHFDELLLPHRIDLSLHQSYRKEVEDNSLKLSSWRDHSKEEQIETNIDKKNNILIETLRSIRSSSTLYSPKTCHICCEDYAKGNDIAWSKNEECAHAFHTDCIVPWLMEHEECPMCRSDYICIESG